MHLSGAASAGEPQLLRRTYACFATGEQRQYLLYLPSGYDQRGNWPVMLYLHGTGERGDGRDELDVVMRYGPLAEAWVRRRDLPFIILSPQLPVFGLHDHAGLRGSEETPARRPDRPPPPYPQPARPNLPVQRAPVETDPVLGIDKTWSVENPPGGWHLMGADLLGMLDRTLAETAADASRVFLTGVSYGGYGSWWLAARHRERFAALVPVCGDADPETAPVLAAEPALPVWAFHGGRDTVVKPQWVYGMIRALEEAGHPGPRLTVHEELGHNCWDRVYGGSDLYHWLLQQQPVTALST